MKLEYSRRIFEKRQLHFHLNTSIGSRVPCGRTGMTILTVAFRNFANAPKNKDTSAEYVRYI
jgi:hypothetical protein